MGIQDHVSAANVSEHVRYLDEYIIGPIRDE